MNNFAGLIGSLLGAATAVLLVALLVQFLTKRIAGFVPRYWTVVVALIVHFFIASLYAVSESLPESGTDFVAASLSPDAVLKFFLADLFVQPLMMMLFFRGKEGQKISYGKAFLVNLSKTALSITVLIVLSACAN